MFESEQNQAAGRAREQLCKDAHGWWMEAAQREGIDLTGFNAEAPLRERLTWARALTLLIGIILSRFSSKMQQSTEAQVRECVTYAARHGIYVPPEYLCVDEAQSGRKQRRDGLNRAKELLATAGVDVFLVFKLSRLFRVAYKGFQFVHENVVDQGLRAISVTQGIDTNNKDTWKGLMFMHGMMDDMLLDTIADHCRAGLSSLFLEGFVTGALPVGYKRVTVEGGGQTNLGRPRTRPAVDSAVADRIRRHWKLHLEGLPLRQGWMRWVREGGPCDPRSTIGRMSYAAYRRLLANPRLTGVWAFGRTRTVWATSRDSGRQVKQPEAEVLIRRWEELRIISDADFYAMQELLAKFRKGPRGPRTKRDTHLWDWVTDVFHCGHCNVRFYQTGAHGKGMQCKEGFLCPQRSVVRREQAVRAVCTRLSELIQSDPELLASVKVQTGNDEANGKAETEESIRLCKREVARLQRRCDDLAEMAGDGDERQRLRVKQTYSVASAELLAANARLGELTSNASKAIKLPTESDVVEILKDLTKLLDNAAQGHLGKDVVHQAAHVFKLLVGGKITVFVEQRPARERTNVRATFAPNWFAGLDAMAESSIQSKSGSVPSPTIEVWLRKPPRIDLLAPIVQKLIDEQGMSFGQATAAVNSKGETSVNSGNVFQAYNRYFEMNGKKPPPRGRKN